MLWSYPQAKVTSSKDFLKDALKAHNNYRAKHGVKPLELCDDVIVMLHWYLRDFNKCSNGVFIDFAALQGITSMGKPVGKTRQNGS